MPNSIDIGDLVQDGVLGLIDAAHRFDEARGIKFETFAERRVRGAMIDALRRDAWPRGVRRQRRELEAAREALRRELGHEPSIADLAASVGSGREAPGPHDRPDQHHRIDVRRWRPASTSTKLAARGPRAVRAGFARRRLREAGRPASACAPPSSRCRGAKAKVIGLYYYGEVTMKQIGAEIGVNESRVSQLHARAIRRLRDALGQLGLQQVAELHRALAKPKMLKAELRGARRATGGAAGRACCPIRRSVL